MPLQIAVVDDLAGDRERLEADIRSFFALRREQLGAFSGYANAEEMLRAFVPGAWNLVFLDIRMEGMDGIGLARRMRAADPRLLIVFLTSSREFAFDAFPVHPFDYLVKPYEIARLHRVLEEALRVLSADERRLAVRVPRDVYEVPLRKICALVAQGHAVEVRLVGGQVIKSIMTFSEIEVLLENEERFLLCLRGVIVNMDEVLSLDGDMMRMKDGSVYPLRVRDRAALVSRFTKYMISRLEGGAR